MHYEKCVEGIVRDHQAITITVPTQSDAPMQSHLKRALQAKEAYQLSSTATIDASDRAMSDISNGSDECSMYDADRRILNKPFASHSILDAKANLAGNHNRKIMQCSQMRCPSYPARSPIRIEQQITMDRVPFIYGPEACLANQFVCLLIEGLSNNHLSSFVTAVIVNDQGDRFLIDRIDTSGHDIDEEYVRHLVCDAIHRTESAYRCRVTSAVTDSYFHSVMPLNKVAGERCNVTKSAPSTILNVTCSYTQAEALAWEIIECQQTVSVSRLISESIYLRNTNKIIRFFAIAVHHADFQILCH